MQRIQDSIKALLQPSAEPVFRADSALFTSSLPEVACALFAPLHYESGYAYPLIVWLHGCHSDERQLVRVMPLLSMRNYVAVAPRGLCTAGPAARPGYLWQQSPEDILQAEARVCDCIQIALGKLHVAENRVFLAGFDCGGTMALRLALQRPQRYAGVISLCGPFPGGQPALGNLLSARRLPICLAVGRYSRQYPCSEVCDTLRLLHSAGMSVTLRQYPCGHELSPRMLADVDRWVIEQVTQRPELTSDENRPQSCQSE